MQFNFIFACGALFSVLRLQSCGILVRLFRSSSVLQTFPFLFRSSFLLLRLFRSYFVPLFRSSFRSSLFGQWVFRQQGKLHLMLLCLSIRLSAGCFYCLDYPSCLFLSICFPLRCLICSWLSCLVFSCLSALLLCLSCYLFFSAAGATKASCGMALGKVSHGNVKHTARDYTYEHA